MAGTASSAALIRPNVGDSRGSWPIAAPATQRTQPTRRMIPRLVMLGSLVRCAGSSLLAEIIHVGREPLDPVPVQGDRAGGRPEPDAGPSRRPARLAEEVADEPDVLRPTPDVDGDPVVTA